jgi:hypothetical protein
MSWLSTPEDRRKQHVQVIAGGNIKDLDKIQERDRMRRINGVFWFLFIFSAVIGFCLFKVDFIKYGLYLFGFSILMLIILIVRYGLHKSIILGRHSKSGWERINKLPGWAYRRMKRKHKNAVRGEHYAYKREGKNFYRRLR